MKKLVALVLALMLAASCMVFAQAETPEKKSVTVMVFMCGTNLEYPNQYQGSGSIASMHRSQYNRDEVNVVVLAGGAEKWHNPEIDPTVLNVVEPTDRNGKVVDTFPAASMGEAETLTNFLNYCHENYPADTYILNLWDHGGGALMDLMQDVNFDKDGLSMEELRTALNNSSFGPKGLDMIMFHACLMGSAEVATVIEPYAKYMVGFEDSSFGFEYDWLRGIEKDASLVETAKRMIDVAYEKNTHLKNKQGEKITVSLSMIDLGYVDQLNAQMDAFFEDMEATLDEKTYSKMSARRRGSMTFGVSESGGWSMYDLIDLGDFVRQNADVNPEAAEKLLATLDTMILYQRTGSEKCTGLTIYHPLDSTQAMFTLDWIDIYNNLGFSLNYTNYVNKFGALLNGVPMAHWEALFPIRTANKDFRSMFVLPLTDEQATHYGDSQLQVLQLQEDGSYTFAYASDDVVVEDNQLTAEYAGTALYATDKDGNRLSAEIAYDVIDGDTIMIPADLTMKGEDGEVTVKAKIACAVDEETKEVIPGFVMTWYEPYHAYTAAMNTFFTDYAAVSIPVNYRTETRNEDGTLLPFDQWEIARTENWTSEINDSWGFSMVADTIDPSKLYATFRITDSQSHLVSSEMLVVKPVAADAGEMRIVYDDLQMAKVNSLTLTPAEDKLQISVAVENLTDVESIIEMNTLTVNGQVIEGKAEAVGSGANWGLLKGEEQYMSLNVPMTALEGIDTVTDMTFALAVKDAATNEVRGTIDVTVVLNMALKSAE